MKAKVMQRPAFATVEVKLAPGDHFTAESDAMASMSANVGFNTRMSGGFFSAIKRKFLGGESLFVNDFYLEEGNEGEVVLTQNTPGDISFVKLQGTSICLQPGAFIACAGDLNMGARYAGFKSMIAREGLFKLQLAGNGTVWFGSYGGIIEKQVKGEYIVDTSHLVAYEPSS